MSNDYFIQSPRKLIEVALPLNVINAACVREKSIRHGHPSTLHLWWARRPLAAARAVLFAQLVNDPSWKWEMENPGKNPPRDVQALIEKKRQELFQIIEKLVQWENTTNEEVLQQARAEIQASWREVCELNKDHPQAAELFNPAQLPAFHDPFAGGGSIPLEAQRLGLQAYASDLNPVAVLINKAMIEIPPKFAGRGPVRPTKKQKATSISECDSDTEWFGTEDVPETKWVGTKGLAEDVRYYGNWMRKQAQKRIGHLYPPVEIKPDMAQGRSDLLVGEKLTVIAWIWARTVKSPNPAFSHVDVPLVSTFVLSSKPGKEAYLEPVIEGEHYHFVVKLGKPTEEAKKGTSAGKRKAFRCLISDTPIPYNYIRAEAKAGRMGQKLIALVVEGHSHRSYLQPTKDMEDIAAQAHPNWKPDCEMPQKHRNFQPPVYGMNSFGDLFTPRQLVALTTFSDLVGEARDQIRQDALAAGMPDNGQGIDSGGTGATAYAEAVSVYLAFQIDQLENHLSTICTWHVNNEQLKNTFARQALPMTWDFAEINPFSNSTGSLANLQDRQIKAFSSLLTKGFGQALQADAANQNLSKHCLISMDPPYYDNIAYADLSDFFYVWIRKNLRKVFPSLLATVAVPKTEELVAIPHRHGGKADAEAFFLNGMQKAVGQTMLLHHHAFPVTIYYAFKQYKIREDATSSIGWETFLNALITVGFELVGTWPIKTEQTAAMKTNINVLASSVVLVCRKRPADAPTISRRQFLRELNIVLPKALDEMSNGGKDDLSPVDPSEMTNGGKNGLSPVAPVDLSQAMIGPGMAVFSKYSAVLEADGTPMTVRTALQLINRFLAEDDFDAETQFCLKWFEQHKWAEGVFGEADVLARSKSTSVDALKEIGIVESGKGKVRLRQWLEYPVAMDFKTDKQKIVWMALHCMIRALKQDGELAAQKILHAIESKSEAIRHLAYRLYTITDRMGQVDDARAYNELITSWSGIESAELSATEQMKF